MSKHSTRDAVEIIHRRFYQGDPQRALNLETAQLNFDIAQALYDLRMEAGLTQQQLAERVGTSHSNISRLEDADYTGHSMAMLRRIAQALGKRVVIGFVPNGPNEGEPADETAVDAPMVPTPEPAPMAHSPTDRVLATVGAVEEF
jgi:transcriptional regulator with XRE-family HTH domain